MGKGDAILVHGKDDTKISIISKGRLSPRVEIKKKFPLPPPMELVTNTKYLPEYAEFDPPNPTTKETSLRTQLKTAVFIVGTVILLVLMLFCGYCIINGRSFHFPAVGYLQPAANFRNYDHKTVSERVSKNPRMFEKDAVRAQTLAAANQLEAPPTEATQSDQNFDRNPTVSKKGIIMQRIILNGHPSKKDASATSVQVSNVIPQSVVVLLRIMKVMNKNKTRNESDLNQQEPQIEPTESQCEEPIRQPEQHDAALQQRLLNLLRQQQIERAAMHLHHLRVPLVVESTSNVSPPLLESNVADEVQMHRRHMLVQSPLVFRVHPDSWKDNSLRTNDPERLKVEVEPAHLYDSNHQESSSDSTSSVPLPTEIDRSSM